MDLPQPIHRISPQSPSPDALHAHFRRGPVWGEETEAELTSSGIWPAAKRERLKPQLRIARSADRRTKESTETRPHRRADLSVWALERLRV